MDSGRKRANQLSIPPPAPALPQPPVLPPGQRQITDMFQPAAVTAAQQQHNALLQQRRRSSSSSSSSSSSLNSSGSSK
jgi:hypothetical protein